jgi:hypothetical protein
MPIPGPRGGIASFAAFCSVFAAIIGIPDGVRRRKPNGDKLSPPRCGATCRAGLKRRHVAALQRLEVEGRRTWAQTLFEYDKICLLTIYDHCRIVV